MACLTAPLTVALVTTAFKKKIPARFHINWFIYLLWGGALALLPQHIYKGEIVWYPPFLTAGLNSIIHEIITIGVPMVGVALIMWLGALVFAKRLKNKKLILNPATLMLSGAIIMIVIDLILS